MWLKAPPPQDEDISLAVPFEFNNQELCIFPVLKVANLHKTNKCTDPSK